MSPQSGDDRLEAELCPDGVLRLWGEATNPEAMASALARLDEQARARRQVAVKVDVTALLFMNAASLKQLVGWLARVAASTDHRYTVALLYDPGRYWQARSLPALRTVAVGVLDLVASETSP